MTLLSESSHRAYRPQILQHFPEGTTFGDTNPTPRMLASLKAVSLFGSNLRAFNLISIIVQVPPKTDPGPGFNYVFDASQNADGRDNLHAALVNAYQVLNTMHDITYRYGTYPSLAAILFRTGIDVHDQVSSRQTTTSSGGTHQRTLKEVTRWNWLFYRVSPFLSCPQMVLTGFIVGQGVVSGVASQRYNTLC